MKRIILVLAAVILCSYAAWPVKPIKKEQLQQILSPKSDTTYIVNFWATWCAPCVKELPHFVKLQSEMSEKPVKVIIVSLDYLSQLQKRVIPFLKQRNIGLTAYLLDESNANTYFEMVSKDWSGAIPATVMVSKDKRAFYEQDFTYEELHKTVSDFINSGNN